jgi:hypothetical protein
LLSFQAIFFFEILNILSALTSLLKLVIYHHQSYPLFITSSLKGDCVVMGRNAVIVILNEVKNLMISTESIIEILRLAPQNDMMTQSPGRRDERGKEQLWIEIERIF